jgi:hypothetical protein
MPEFLSETPQYSAVYCIDHSRVRTIDQGTFHANCIALINKLQQKYAFNVYENGGVFFLCCRVVNSDK